MDDKDKSAANNPWQAWWPGYYGQPGSGFPQPPNGANMPPPWFYGQPCPPYPSPYAPPPGWTPPAGAPGAGGGLFSGISLQNDAFLKGLLIGAGASLLLSNEAVQKNTMSALVKLWAGVQGSVEELKERFRDIEAEIQAEADSDEQP